MIEAKPKEKYQEGKAVNGSKETSTDWLKSWAMLEAMQSKILDGTLNAEELGEFEKTFSASLDTTLCGKTARTTITGRAETALVPSDPGPGAGTHQNATMEAEETTELELDLDLSLSGSSGMTNTMAPPKVELEI
jgi:hypothetical protein